MAGSGSSQTDGGRHSPAPQEGDMDRLSTAAPPCASAHQASCEPWSLEQILHLALAAVVIIGWTLVYTTLMRGIVLTPPARMRLTY